jgi:YD repeat-containing protein
MDNRSGPGWQANMVLENAPTHKDLNYTLEYDGVTTAGPTQSWAYSLGANGSAVVGPDGGLTQEWASEGLSMGRVYKTRHPNGSVIERLWKQNRPFSPPGVSFASNAGVNPFVEAEFYSVPDAGGVLILTSMRHYTYDKNGNLTQMKEYDWVPYNNVVRDSFGLPTGIPAGATLKRMTTTAYHCETPGALDTTTSDPDSYDRAGSPSFKKAAKSTVIGNGSQTMARSEFTYDDPLTTANLTEERHWDSTRGAINASAPFLDANNSFATSTQYNQYGNPTLTTDARQVQTQFIYGQVGAFIDLYPTEIRTAAGTAVQRIEKRDYDFNTGLVTRLTDFDNGVSTSTQYDPLGRPVLVRMAEGKAEEMQTSTQYFGPERRIVTRSDLETTGDGKIARVVHFDQLGRVRLTRTLEEYSVAAIANETIGIKTQTRYLTFNPCQPFNSGQCLIDNGAVLANYVLTSNAYRAATPSAATGESTMGWMRVRTDNSSRTVEIRTFAGVNLPGPWDNNTISTGGVTTAYDGVYTKVTDQAGKVRRRRVDGLGQLIRVDEPSDASNNLGSQSLPSQATTYDYNVFGSLISVAQGGQTRSYVYSSLNRLIQATNPESGTVNYEYDASGNITKKIDPRLIPNTSTRQATTYTYDPPVRLGFSLRSVLRVRH